jgi:rhomboid protease GluP
MLENTHKGRMSMKKITYNAPVTLTFSFLAFAVLLLDFYTAGEVSHNLFSVYRSPLTDPLFYLRLIGHVLGHATWEHLLGNMLLILLLGPMLEEKYGSGNLLKMILLTALLTGAINLLFFPHALMGASGIVFMMILLSSFTNAGKHELPLTVLLVAVLYIGREIMAAWVIEDNISRMTHIAGGMTGAWFGFKAKSD